MSAIVCEAATELTDADIATIVRSVAASSDVAQDIGAVALFADCRLSREHAGAHACWVARARDGFGDEATAWLRWTGDAHTIDWLVDCTGPDCPLFRGHAGECNPQAPDATT